MTTFQLDMNLIMSMRSKPLHNYALAGLDSFLVGGGNNGCVRLFEMTREQHGDITPHSHRFDFQCVVLEGEVLNRIWLPTTTDDLAGDFFQETILTYEGEPGKYISQVNGRDFYKPIDSFYHCGQTYSMKADQIHSIFFEKGTKVLFFEGPILGANSVILEPVVDNEVIPTFKVEDWMFKKC